MEPSGATTGAEVPSSSTRPSPFSPVGGLTPVALAARPARQRTGAGIAVQLEDAAAESRDPDGLRREHAMIDGLPSRAVLVRRKRHRLPVADVRPLQLQRPVDPGELVL